MAGGAPREQAAGWLLPGQHMQGRRRLDRGGLALALTRGGAGWLHRGSTAENSGREEWGEVRELAEQGRQLSGEDRNWGEDLRHVQCVCVHVCNQEMERKERERRWPPTEREGGRLSACVCKQERERRRVGGGGWLIFSPQMFFICVRISIRCVCA